jgi:formylglycine-generating enzyme required for sulfatase activity
MMGYRTPNIDRIANHYPEEAPAHEVAVDGFWMDPCPVTNLQFKRFVEATKYVTLAERPPNPADFPGAPPENLVPGSMVFQPARPLTREELQPAPAPGPHSPPGRQGRLSSLRAQLLLALPPGRPATADD